MHTMWIPICKITAHADVKETEMGAGTRTIRSVELKPEGSLAVKQKQ